MYRCYKDFCSKYMRLILLFELLAVTGLTCFLSRIMGNFAVGLIIGMSTHLVLVTVLDFWMFGGIAIKKQKAMDWVRSSFYGPEIIRKALIIDAIISSVKIVFIVAVLTVCEVLWGETDAKKILFLIGFLETGYILLVLVLMLTRCFCATFQMQLIISYLLSTVGMLIFVPLIMLWQTEKMLPLVVYTVIAMPVAIWLGIRSVKVCMKGFYSGYCN